MSQSVLDARLPSSGGPFRRNVAFVFQGGGSLSAPQVGMLRALTQAGITPDLVIGTSAGALNAVAYASDPTPQGLARLEQLWLTLRRQSVAHTSLRTIARALIGRSDGLFDATPLAQLLRTGILAAALEDTEIPAHVVAADLATGQPVILSHGDTQSALLASSAFPGIYSPVDRGGLRLIDGGVVADVPVLQAEALGAEACYLLPAAVSDDRAPHGPIAMAYHALGQILDGNARRDALAARGEVYVLTPATSPATNPLDFRETRRLIEDGYRLARQWLAAQPSPASLR